MKIVDIYKKYYVPKHLQQHMVNAAALGFYMCLKRKSIDFRAVVSSLLLHDLANLIKFDIAKGVYLFDKSEQKKELYWQKRGFQKKGSMFKIAISIRV